VIGSYRFNVAHEALNLRKVDNSQIPDGPAEETTRRLPGRKDVWIDKIDRPEDVGLVARWRAALPAMCRYI